MGSYISDKISLLVNSGNFVGTALCNCIFFTTYHVWLRAHLTDTDLIMKRIQHLNHLIETEREIMFETELESREAQGYRRGKSIIDDVRLLGLNKG